jgi:RNA polymerase sigma-70 factor, ECF subfamily
VDQQGIDIAGAPTARASIASIRDADLHELCRQRDFHAVLAELMVRYRQKVLHLAYSIVRDRAMAEDLSQVAFVKAWQALPRFDGRAALSTWLYTIVRNTCISELRRAGRTVSLDAVAEGGDESWVESLADNRPSAELAAVEYDAAALVERLAEPYRRVVTLFYLEERSVDEVAAMLEMPEGTVKSLLFRARQLLADAAGGGGPRTRRTS